MLPRCPGGGNILRIDPKRSSAKSSCWASTISAVRQLKSVDGARTCLDYWQVPIQQLLVCRCWLLLYGVIVRGFSSMNGKWVFFFCCSYPYLTWEAKKRALALTTSQDKWMHSTFYHDNPDVMSCHLSDVWTFPPHSTQHKDEEDIDEPLRRLRQSEKK